MDKRIEQLLAWYVNGTLVGPERNRVEDALARDESAQKALRWESAVRTSMKTDPLYDMVPEHGLFEVMQRIRADAPAAASPRVRAPRKPALSSAPGHFPSVLERVRDWISASPGLAIACTLIAVQFAVIGQMMVSRNDDIAYAESRALQNAAARGETFIRILFKADTGERQMSSMLRANNAEIVAGPTQLGEYYLLVKPNEATQTLTRLLTNAHVDSAEIVNALPNRP